MFAHTILKTKATLISKQRPVAPPGTGASLMRQANGARLTKIDVADLQPPMSDFVASGHQQKPTPLVLDDPDELGGADEDGYKGLEDLLMFEDGAEIVHPKTTADYCDYAKMEFDGTRIREHVDYLTIKNTEQVNKDVRPDVMNMDIVKMLTLDLTSLIYTKPVMTPNFLIRDRFSRGLLTAFMAHQIVTSEDTNVTLVVVRVLVVRHKVEKCVVVGLVFETMFDDKQRISEMKEQDIMNGREILDKDAILRHYYYSYMDVPYSIEIRAVSVK